MKKKTTVELTRVSLSEYRRQAKQPLRLLADNVRSMQNIGSMLRTCDAFAVKEMIMCGISAVPPHAEISKTALGAEDSVAWRYAADSLAEIKSLKEQGLKIAVLEQTHGSIPLSQFSLGYGNAGGEWVLVVGNEVEGVDQRIVDIADVALEIPMAGIKHSLNVAVCTGIALYSITQTPLP